MPAIQVQMPAIPTAASAGSEPRSATSGDFGNALTLLLGATSSGMQPMAVGTEPCRGETSPAVPVKQENLAPPGTVAQFAAFSAIASQDGTRAAFPAATGPDTGATPEFTQFASDPSPPGADAAVPLSPKQLPDAAAPAQTALAASADEAPVQPGTKTAPGLHAAAKPRRKIDNETMADTPLQTASVVTPAVTASVEPPPDPTSRTQHASDLPPTSAAPIQSAALHPRKVPGPAIPDDPGAADTTASAANGPAKSLLDASAPTPSRETAATAPLSPVTPPLLTTLTASQPDALQPAAKSAPHADLPSVAAQIEPALVSLAQTAHGMQRLTLRLQPAELGQVEIRVDRSAGTPVRVEILVQRPETLTLLLRDQTQLQHTLDQAGLSPDGRSLTLHVASPPPSSAINGGFASLGQGTGNGYQPGGSNQSNSQSNAGDSADGDPADPGMLRPLRWLRAGLDITA